MRLTGKRIFIVEDNPGNCIIMKILLEAHKAIVCQDRWCRDTISRMKEALPLDLVLMDLMLPDGLTGYDVYDRMRAEPDLARIPVVAVSASDPDLEMEKARRKGFGGYIEKPINNSTFSRAVTCILEGHEVWGENDYLAERLVK